MFILNPSRFASSGGGGGFFASFNFRASEGYVSDGINETFVGADLYPTTRDGLTFGWETLPEGRRDRDDTADRRLVGMHFTRDFTAKFRVDLPASGTYLVSTAGHDATYIVSEVVATILDDTTALANLDSTSAGFSPSAEVWTQDNVAVAEGIWTSSPTATTFAFGSTIFRYQMEVLSPPPNIISHITIKDV